MRILKVLLAAVVAVLAVVAGAFVFALIAAAVVIFLLARWARGRVTHRAGPRRRTETPSRNDVIDVVATEKKDAPETLQG